jgi:hypothetical protein
MLAILQPFYCDQSDSEQGQFPALDELLGSMHRPVSRRGNALLTARSSGCFQHSMLLVVAVCMVCALRQWCDWVNQAMLLAAAVLKNLRGCINI